MLDSALENNLEMLLQGMLTPIRRARATPLQFEIDSSGIARAALGEFLANSPAPVPNRPEAWKPVMSALDLFIARTLADEICPPRSEHTSPIKDNAGVSRPSSPGIATGGLHPLAAWLDRFFNVMRTVDHRAFEILGRRVEGLQDRDIAVQLDLGLRLVKRITHEMRVRWASEIVKE